MEKKITFELIHFADKKGNDFDSVITDDINDLVNHFLALEDDMETVYLLSYGNEVFISEDIVLITKHLQDFNVLFDGIENLEGLCEIHLQHYSSYEEAYETALDIRAESGSPFTFADDDLNEDNNTFTIDFSNN